MLYSIIFPLKPVLQIRRQWLSSTNISNADVWGEPSDPSLRQRYCKDRIDYWPPHIEDAYLEGNCYAMPEYRHTYTRTARLTMRPDGERHPCQIIADTIYERTGKMRTRKQVSNHYHVSLGISPSPTALRAFLRRGSPRMQPLPHHFQSLMLLNRRFYRETLDYLYSEAVLDFGEDMEAIPLFVAQIGPELADLIKSIRCEHIEHSGKSCGEGTNTSMDLLEAPLRALLPSLQSLHLVICPWPYYLWRSKVPPWATSMEQLGRVLSTNDIRIHLSLTFESQTAFADHQHITVEEKPPRGDKLAQLPESGSNPLDCFEMIQGI